MIGSLASLALTTSLIATFASHTPPPAVRRPFKLHSSTSTAEVWLTPGPSRLSTLACEHNGTIHYFRYTFDNAIVVSQWGKLLSLSEKKTVFKEIQDWYYRVSNKPLTSNMTFAEDALAWQLSR